MCFQNEERELQKANKQAKRIKLKTKRKAYTEFTSGLAQLMVLLNGVVLTLAAFLVLTHYINTMSDVERRKTSQETSRILLDGITDLQNSMRLVTSVINVSQSRNRDALSEQIRRNLPNLRKFDQLIWLYEDRPGNWQYKTIYSLNRVGESQESYYLTPNKDLITRLINENVFANDGLRIFSDLGDMGAVVTGKGVNSISRSFALLKVVQSDRSDLGVVIGVSRPDLMFDQKLVSKESSILRLVIEEPDSEQPLYKAQHLDFDKIHAQNEDISQSYNFKIADREWSVLLDFSKKENAALLEKIPYIILLFGCILTVVGTLFIRSNHMQSKRLERVNSILEQKNFQLKSEVSERERLNSALASAEKDNRAIIDAVSDVIFEVDIDGQVLFLSAAWHKVTGFEIERSKGSNLFSMLSPEDQEKQRNDFVLLLKGQKPTYRSFTRIRISDGTFRAIELALSMIRQDENKKLRVVGTITDVEERRRAERALAEAEKKYRTIVENAAGGLYQLTPEGIYLSANPAMARILGYSSPEEMLRLIKNANGIVYPELSERQRFNQTLNGQGQMFGYETEVITKDKTKIWVRENVRVVKDEQNNILYYEGSMEDITQRKEADIALMEAKIQSDMASRAKTEFIANMSHELRTPLNAIIGFSDIMKNEVMGPLGQDMYKEYVQDINKSGHGLLKVINEILDISKIESGNHDLKESEFTFSGVLQSCLDLYEARVQDKQITLINEMADLPSLIGEELSIKQVVGNIYSNAIKFTPNEGRITLFSNYDLDGTFRISITDTGVGMTHREVTKAMSPFGQLDNALDRSGSGTGLGLPLSRAIMDIHDGRIEVLSEKAIGTTVTIIFPPERVMRRDVTSDADQVSS